MADIETNLLLIGPDFLHQLENQHLHCLEIDRKLVQHATHLQFFAFEKAQLYQMLQLRSNCDIGRTEAGPKQISHPFIPKSKGKISSRELRAL